MKGVIISVLCVGIVAGGIFFWWLFFSDNLDSIFSPDDIVATDGVDHIRRSAIEPYRENYIDLRKFESVLRITNREEFEAVVEEQFNAMRENEDEYRDILSITGLSEREIKNSIRVDLAVLMQQLENFMLDDFLYEEFDGRIQLTPIRYI